MKADSDSGCPPPTMTVDANGVMGLQPHCWRCASKIRQLVQPTPAPPVETRTDRPKDWPAIDLAQHALAHCRGMGQTFQEFIESFSNKAITKAATPKEYARRLNCLYTMRRVLQAAVLKLSAGSWRLEVRYKAFGKRRDGKWNNIGYFVVVPNKEATA